MIIFIPKRITKIFHYKIFFVLFSWFRFLLLCTQNAPKKNKREGDALPCIDFKIKKLL